MDAITLHSNFDAASLVFSPVAKTSKGSKIVYISGPNNARLKIQTPVLSAPFGISSFDDVSSGGKSYSLDASFKGYDSNAKIGGFLEKCRGFDERLLQEGTANSKSWLGKAMGPELVAEFMRRCIREANDPAKYAPTMRLKITPTTEFFDEHHNPCAMDYVTKGTSFRAIIEVSSVYFVNKNFGVSFRIAQLAVVNRPDRLNGFAFQGEDDEEEDAVEI